MEPELLHVFHSNGMYLKVWVANQDTKLVRSVPLIPTAGTQSSTYTQFLMASVAAMYHSAQRTWFGAATHSPRLLSQHIVLFDTGSCTKSPSALEEEHGHPLSHTIFISLTVAPCAREANPAVPEAVP